MKEKTIKDSMVVVNNDNKYFYRKNKIKIVNNEEYNSKLLSLDEALNISLSMKLDLVIVKPGFFSNGKEVPSIAKFIDYNKFLYDKKKKEKEIAKKQRENIQKVKCVKFHIGIDSGDYNCKLKHIKEFLDDGNKVSCQIVLRGREKFNNEIANSFIEKITSDFNEFAKFEKPFNRQGALITASLLKKEIK